MNRFYKIRKTISTQLDIIDIDEILPISVTGNETISRIDISKDNWVTSTNLTSPSFGSETDIFIDYETIGSKTISVRATSAEGFISESSLSISVERGNAIEINTLNLNNFFNINETWDDEFDEGDINRLADVFFIFLKPRLNPFDGTRSINSTVWYRSETLLNQGNLEWSIADQLLIDPDLSLYIAFADDDGNGLIEDIMLGPPFEREISFEDFTTTQPDNLSISYPDINLDFDLSVDW